MLLLQYHVLLLQSVLLLHYLKSLLLLLLLLNVKCLLLSLQIQVLVMFQGIDQFTSKASTL